MIAGALPADDPALLDPKLDLDTLARHWAAQAVLDPMSAEQMRGADSRSQRLGIRGDRLMEHAGAGVAAAARALLHGVDAETGTVLVLCGPGNNGGDGLVCARHLARSGHSVAVGLIAAGARPTAADAVRNWERLSGIPGVPRFHTPTARDVRISMAGIERAALVIDALLGTGVRGPLREPIRTAVLQIVRARELGVPVVSVDTPTVVDLTSGEPSAPVVRADVTVTFHRPKLGLRTPTGSALAGRILVAPIGIPAEADRP